MRIDYGHYCTGSEDCPCIWCERDRVNAAKDGARSVARGLVEALPAATERLRHLHGLCMSGEPRQLDFERELSGLRGAVGMGTERTPLKDKRKGRQ